MDRLEDALLAKARVSALFCAFVTGSGETDFKPGDDHALSMERGTVGVLPADTSVTFPVIPTLSDAPQFLVSQIRSFASGCNLPDELVSGDLSLTNYSSSRLGFGQFRERVKAIRRTVLTPPLVRIFRPWLALEVVAGRIIADGPSRGRY